MGTSVSCARVEQRAEDEGRRQREGSEEGSDDAAVCVMPHRFTSGALGNGVRARARVATSPRFVWANQTYVPPKVDAV